MLLTKDFVAENKELFFGKEPKLVSLGEMNGQEAQVYVIPLSALNAMEILFDEKNKDKSMNVLFVAACVVDEYGERIFDVEEVEQLNFKLYEKLLSAVFGSNAILDADKGIEEAEKNLEEVDS